MFVNHGPNGRGLSMATPKRDGKQMLWHKFNQHSVASRSAMADNKTDIAAVKCFAVPAHCTRDCCKAVV